ncbi:MAG: thymidylate kinase [Deltaproteobacteria bacterium]|nr:thymidylate kinase [Deltaproteobacteria bacterium]MCB9785449.1 thymidylate kinase [Deltaproteobacteria bacterium]
MIIAVSGVDGAGKSTQIARLESWLRAHGARPEVLWHRPGYSPALDLARATLRRLRPGALPTPGPSAARERAFSKPHVRRGWAALALLDSLVHYAAVVRARSLAGRAVICDRYVDDGLLDLRLRFSDLRTERWPATRALRALSPRPDLSILLMLDRAEVQARVARKAEPFPDPPEMRERRHAAYEALAATGRFTVVDASGPPEVVFERIRALLPAPLRAEPGEA